jgi:CHAT domain-containing protein/Tfp pilus assembly protein PilF
MPPQLKVFVSILLPVVLSLGIYLTPITAAPLSQDGDPKAQADTLFNEGLTLVQDYHAEAALRKFEEALALYHSLEDRSGEGLCLIWSGYASYLLSDYAGALDFYEASLSIFQEIDDQQKEVWALNNIGTVHFEMGQFERAGNYFQRALTLGQELGNDSWTDSPLLNLGAVHQKLGQYEQALEYLRQALAISREYGDRATEATALNIIGLTYYVLGQHEKALDYYQQALAIHREVGNRAGEHSTLTNIGYVYDVLEQYEQMLSHFQEALTIARDIGDREGEGKSLNDIGVAHDKLGQFEKALDYYNQALAIERAIGDRLSEATTLNNAGAAFSKLGQHEQSLEYQLQALVIYREVGLRTWEGTILHNIAMSYEKLGNTAQAINFYQQAVEVKESIERDIKVEEFKASYAGDVRQASAYAGLIHLLWEDGRFEEAFDYVERARARAFLDQLAGDVVDFRVGTASTLLECEETLRIDIATKRAQLVALQKRPRDQLDAEAITAAQAELKDLEEDYSALLIELKLQSPEVAELVSVDVAPLAEIQALLDTDTTLVEYFVAEEHTLAFVISHNTFEAVALDVSREDLARTIDRFRVEDFAAPSESDPRPSNLQQLHTWLIAPLQPYLSTPMLGIVPHGVLHYLPFAALTDGERYLSDDFVLFTLPSASTLRFLKEKRKPEDDTLLALGNPTIAEPLPALRFAEGEVKAIADLYGTQPLLGEEATESAVWSGAGGARLLHLAAHGEYNPFNPLFSAIHLASNDEHDGRLEVHEVYGLDLTAATDLVVLSACQTQIGELSAGDEIVGLNRAFLYAGTPSVVASLWSVDDEATALLMQRFYTHLRAGTGKAEALRQAQLEVRAEYPHPYYWAAFVLTGDPGDVTGEIIAEEATPTAIDNESDTAESVPEEATLVATDTAEEVGKPTSGSNGPCGSTALLVGLALLTALSLRHYGRIRRE